MVAIIIQPPRELDAVPSLFSRTSVASSDNRRMSVDSMVAPPPRRVGIEATTSRGVQGGVRWSAARFIPCRPAVKPRRHDGSSARGEQGLPGGRLGGRLRGGGPGPPPVEDV